MRTFVDVFGNTIRLSSERLHHIYTFHPEMKHQLRRIKASLVTPDAIFHSKSDKNVTLYYRLFTKTPIGSKYLCVVVKSIANDYFILTTYFTDALKSGDLVWRKTKQ